MPHKKISKWLLLLLSMLAMLSPLISDMYLPIFPDLVETYNTLEVKVQSSLTTFLVGLSLGQFISGPLSDSYGRKRVALLFLIFLTIFSAGLVFAPSIDFFNLLRFFQGFAGGACIVIARSIIADLSSGVERIKALSFVTMLIGLAPIVAPLLGGVVADLFGWRIVLLLFAVISLLLLVVSYIFLPDSLPPTARVELNVLSILKTFLHQLKNPVFLRAIAIIGFSFANVMAYISVSPFLGITILGLSEIQYSLIFASGATALFLANLINTFLAGKVRQTTIIVVGGALMTLTSIAYSLIFYFEQLNTLSFLLFGFLVTGSMGVILPNAVSFAFEQIKNNIGSASALIGSIQFLIGAVAPLLAGIMIDQNFNALIITLVLFAVLTLFLSIKVKNITKGNK